MPTSPLQLQLFSEAAGPAPDAAPERPRARRQHLRRRLQTLSPGRFRSVTLTDNRSTIVSARDAAGGGLDVRIHRCFVGAPEETLGAVADFLTSGKRSVKRTRALAAIRDFFHGHRPAGEAAPARRRIVLRPAGRRFDLRQLRDAVNERYFDGLLSVRITWGRAFRRNRRRRSGFSVRLGTYCDRDNVVRIHRCLDRDDVPRYVVESVVHHEMLHAAVPPVETGGRRRIHTPEFRRRERLFRHHDAAERWLERHLPRLLGVR